jgi:hypothetical protein
MDEYVKVTYPTRRTVWVDGEESGYTNKVFQVQTGRHTFDLGPYQNYKPSKRAVDVRGTTPADPMIIAFSPADD